MSTSNSTRLPQNVSGPAWVSTPELVGTLTAEDPIAGLTLEDAIAVAQERLKVITLKQRPAAKLRAALKVAGVARVTMNAHNRTWRDSANGKRIAKPILAGAR